MAEKADRVTQQGVSADNFRDSPAGFAVYDSSQIPGGQVLARLFGT